MTSDCIDRPGSPAGRPAHGLAELVGLWSAAKRWRARRRTRRQLHTLSDQMLRDLGLGRADLELTALGQPYPRRPERYL